MYVDQMTGSLRLANDSLHIDSLSARAGRGTISLTGGLRVATLSDPTFNLFAVARNAQVLDNERGRLNADAGLRLTGPLARPYLSGNVRVFSGVVYIPIPAVSTSSARAIPTSSTSLTRR